MFISFIEPRKNIFFLLVDDVLDCHCCHVFGAIGRYIWVAFLLPLMLHLSLILGCHWTAFWVAIEVAFWVALTLHSGRIDVTFGWD